MTARMMLLLAMLLAAPSAMAHSPLAASVPVDGAVLTEAPGSLRLTFEGEASLARLSLWREGTEMALGTAHLMQVGTQHHTGVRRQTRMWAECLRVYLKTVGMRRSHLIEALLVLALQRRPEVLVVGVRMALRVVCVDVSVVYLQLNEDGALADREAEVVEDVAKVRRIKVVRMELGLGAYKLEPDLDDAESPRAVQAGPPPETMPVEKA